MESGDLNMADIPKLSSAFSPNRTSWKTRTLPAPLTQVAKIKLDYDDINIQNDEKMYLKCGINV